MHSPVELTGSHWPLLAGARLGAPVPELETFRISVILRRREHAGRSLQLARPLLHQFPGRAAFAEHFGAAPDEAESVVKTLASLGWETERQDLTRRTVWMRGTAAAVRRAFGVTPVQATDGLNHAFRTYEGALTVPASIAPFVIGVFGIDNRPVARFGAQRARRPPHRHGGQASLRSFLPTEVAAIYSFPPGTSGAGQTIGLIELGGGFRQSDIDAAFLAMSLPPPTPVVVSVDGAANSPGVDADDEVALDIQVAGGCAPKARLVIYFSTLDDKGFLDAVSAAINDTTNNPSVISISWSGNEDVSTTLFKIAMDAFLADAGFMGITVCVASGDKGAAGFNSPDSNAHAEFPATSPNALACGGTVLRTGASGPDEEVWNHDGSASGGGISTSFAVPAYQMGLALPASANPGAAAARGVPDVAANADPQSGFRIMVNGQVQQLGGTSAAAPLWAALIACMNESLGGQLGFIHPALYALANNGVFNDITSGTNDVGNDNNGYAASPGWDCCTGLGSPRGISLLANLRPARLSDFFPPNEITCGYSGTGTVWIDNLYATDVHVQVTSDMPVVLSVATPTVIVPAGSLSAPVTFNAPAQAGDFRPLAVAIHASYAGKTLDRLAYVAPPRVTGLTLSAGSVVCGSSVQGTISLNVRPLLGSLDVQLYNAAPGFATVPPTVTINQGQLVSDPFTIQTPNLQSAFAPAHVALQAVLRADVNDPGSSASATLEVLPQVQVGVLQSLTLSASEMSQGNTCTGTVTLAQAVGTPTTVFLTALDPQLPGGSSLPTSSNGSSLVTLPGSVLIPAGQLQAHFTIQATTSSIHGSKRSVTILAGAVQTWSRPLTIDF